MTDIKTFDAQVQGWLRSDGGLDRSEAAQLQSGFRALQDNPTTRNDALRWAIAQDRSLQGLVLGGSYDDYTGAKATPRQEAPAGRPGGVRDNTLDRAGTLDAALARTPGAVSEVYDLSRQGDKLVADPPGPRTRSFSVTTSARGGKELAYAQGGFDRAEWTNASYRDVLTRRLGADRAGAELTKLRSAGFDVDARRDFLVVNGTHASERDPTYVAFSRDPSRRGVVTICNEVGVHDFSNPGAILMRKPVIYVYPPTKMRVRVDVTVDGELTVLYPKPNRPSTRQVASWDVVATPEGSLFVPETERVYSYLFWEGTTPNLAIDPREAACVPGTQSESFLEDATRRLGLNDRERTDFISYWLPALERSNYNLVQFLTAEAYGAYARLAVDPKPDHLLRIFMVFRGCPEQVICGAPELPRAKRGGFTVVEWGGADLGAV